MSDWQSTIAAQLAAETRDPTARWVQLGTVSADGAPAVRTVVFRGHHGEALVFTTDTRSAKLRHIRHEPRVEVLWNFAQSRMQLRIAGKMVAVAGDCPDAALESRRRDVWRTLSEEVRAGFIGGPPGRPLDEPRIGTVTPPADGPPPATFALLVLWPERVDQVELAPQPHRRTLHARDAAGQWHARAVHP